MSVKDQNSTLLSPECDTTSLLNPELAGVSPPELDVVERNHYLIEGEYARGGLGRILEAHDQRLDRPVAIKELIDPRGSAIARFVREALVTARLQHPAIVPVYEAGRWPTGEPFYAMKLVTGRSVRELIDERRSLDERLALLPNVIAVADAIAYAHSMRIIHRDIKPSNVLVGSFGETVVIDWGLAKDLDGGDASDERVVEVGSVPYDVAARQLTIVGEVMGTPTYMSPEQADGQPLDERTDVYALGALLYHVLVGAPPYAGSGILEQVRAVPPPPVDERQKGVPRELAAIVRKAMARHLEERYRTARELAEDLRRFQTGQFVSAQFYSWPLRILRWLQRYRAPASVVALCLLALLVTAAVSFYRVVRERNGAEEQRVLAQKERTRADERANELILQEARSALERDPTMALAWLKTYPLEQSGLEKRGVVVRGWERVRDLGVEARERGVARHLFLRDYRKISYGDFSPDGKRFVDAGPGHTVRIWDVQTGAVVAERPHPGEIYVTRFAPDGRTVAIIDWESPVIVLWDSASGGVRTLRDQEGLAQEVHFSSDGQWLLSASDDGAVRLWNLTDGSRRAWPAGVRGGRLRVSLAPDGRSWAAASTDGTVRLGRVDTGTPQLLHGGRPGDTWVQHSPDGKWLAFGGSDGAVGLWEMATGRKQQLGRFEREAVECAFSPDSRLLAVSSFDGTIRLWDLSTRTVRVLRGHFGEVYAVAFSSDGQELASGGQDGTVRRWHLGTGEVTVLRGHTAEVLQVTYAPVGRWLASAANDGTARLWELPEGRNRILRGHADDVMAVVFSPDGERLATASLDATVRLWGKDGRAGPVLRGHTGMVWRIAFSPDGRNLVSGSYDHTLRWWDTTTGVGRLLGSHEGVIRALLMLDGGATVATAGGDGMVRLWNTATGESQTIHRGQGEVRALAGGAEGRWLAWAGEDHTVYVYERATGMLRKLSGHEDAVYALAFSPTGQRLVSAAGDGTVRLWELAGGEGRLLGRHRARVRAVAFAPDGRWLASAGEDGLLQLWPLGSPVDQGARVLAGHSAVILQLAFSPDGTILATASWDGTVRLWNVAFGATYRILHHDGPVASLAFAPAGDLMASVSTDNTARLWKVESTPVLPILGSQLRPWMNSLSSAVLDTEGRWSPESGR